MMLCRICNSANSDFFDEGECAICEGRALLSEDMLREAGRLLREEKPKSFCISTKIPKDWLAREERAWDIRLKGAESIKNRLNRMVKGRLAGLADYENDADARIVLDYSDGSVRLLRNDLFVFGRYLKHVPGLSQSRWRCRKCGGTGCNECDGKGKYYVSVEEKIGEPLKELSQSDDYVLHASGREDVDATNSAGRIFVIMLSNPKNREIDLEDAARRIAGSNEVSVKDMKFVRRGFVEVVTESHFDKTYTAEAEFGREIGPGDIEKIRSLAGEMVAQRTPQRVSHRRADLVRKRRVKIADVIKHEGKCATIRIKAEAGTYIKELISGDEGRTEPSIAALLGTGAKCTRLDVSEIDDGFISLF
jgi:tRNA pseudouridine synthase 10